MANLTENLVPAFAHCPNPRCPGNAQEPVDGVLRHTEVLYTDTDPNGIPGVEKSFENLSFAEEDQAPCSHCDLYREISQQVRPTYENHSKQDPLELLKRQQLDLETTIARGFEKVSNGGSGDAENAELRALVKQQGETLARLEAELATKATKSGPKPKAD